MILLFFLLAAVCNSSGIPDLISLVKQESQLCTSPDGLPFLYSGFRAYQVRLIDWPVRHFWYVARCSQGTIVEQQFFPTNRTTNFLFGKSLCLSKNECYIISRRRKYARRSSPLYLPFVTVGAIYKHDPFTNKTVAVALMKSDRASAKVILDFGMLTKLQFTPVLFSSGSFFGSSAASKLEILPFENYTYVEADTSKTWWKVNEFVNKLVRVWEMGDNQTFWEFDALQRHLSDEMNWRDKLNNAVVGLSD